MLQLLRRHSLCDTNQKVTFSVLWFILTNYFLTLRVQRLHHRSVTPVTYANCRNFNRFCSCKYYCGITYLLAIYLSIYLSSTYLSSIQQLSVICPSVYLPTYHASVIYGGSAYFYNYVTNIFKLFYIHSKYNWNYPGNYLIWTEDLWTVDDF